MIFYRKIEFLFHEDSQYRSTGVSKYCGEYKILYCLSKNRLYTKMLRLHLARNCEDTDKCTLNITKSLHSYVVIQILRSTKKDTYQFLYTSEVFQAKRRRHMIR